MAPLDNFIIDLSNYKERFGSRVPEGKYTVRVDDAELDTSKAGNQMINVWYVIANGEHAGQTITDRLVLSEKSMFRVVAFMHAIGLSTKKQKHTLSTRTLIGKVLTITVEDGEPYNGNVRSEVKAYERPSAVVSATQSDDLENDLGDDEPVNDTAPVVEETVTESAPTAVTVTSAQNDLGEIDLDDLGDEL